MRFSATSLPPGVTLRPMSEDDRSFILALYTATRAPEFAATGWPEPMLRQFLAQQEHAQHAQYRHAWPDADRLIVERDGGPVGRLYVDDGPKRLHLIDISLLPKARGLGLGTALLRILLDETARSGKPVMLRVERGNPARRLYERLGFESFADLGAYEEMRYFPENIASRSA